MNNPDWRADIREFDSLDDLDPLELIRYLKHTYLTSAGDLLKDGNHPDDKVHGEMCAKVAALLQQADDVIIASLPK